MPNKKLDGLQIAHKIATLNGGKCLSDKYINVDTKMLWQCDKKHTWNADLYHIKNRNQWCPECGGTKKLDGLKIAHEISKIYGGKCLSQVYENNEKLMEWECKYFHKWQASLVNIKTNHSWCPKCAITERSERQILSNAVYKAQKMANENNGKCLSNKYINAKSKLLWMCDAEHKWLTSYDNIKNGKWCPECKIFKSQKKLKNIIEQITGKEAILNYKGFDWLKTSKYGKQELDIYIPELKLAIEYDGKQHFKPVRFGGISLEKAKENLRNTKKLDKIKNKKIEQHKDEVKYFIRFNYKNKITEEYVVERLKGIGIL